MAGGSQLLEALRDPVSVFALSLRDLESLIHEAKRLDLLARLAEDLEATGQLDRLPRRAQDLLFDAKTYAHVNQTDIRFEVNRVMRALVALEVPLILLKGGAYILAGLPPARGRLAADLDIMVPQAWLAQVEQALLRAGWEQAELSAYDEHYYRAWMHEVPPFIHPERGVTLDLHHTILPRTSRYHPDPKALAEAARPLPGGRLKVLCPADMVLHSAVHLANEEVNDASLRNLLDLRDLLQEFGGRPAFWDELTQRAALHGLQRPLAYVLRCLQALLGVSLPAETQRLAAPSGGMGTAIVDGLFATAITPRRKRRSLLQGGARLALYMRAHWIKMPLAQLAGHLGYKAWLRWRPALMAPKEPRRAQG